MTRQELRDLRHRLQAIDTYGPLARAAVFDDMLRALANLETQMEKTAKLEAFFDHYADLERNYENDRTEAPYARQ